VVTRVTADLAGGVHALQSLRVRVHQGDGDEVLAVESVIQVEDLAEVRSGVTVTGTWAGWTSRNVAAGCARPLSMSALSVPLRLLVRV